MNHYLLSMFALELARERSRQAERYWRAAALAGAAPSRNPRVRRLVARLLASVSVGSAWIVRRLDSCVADDLGRTLAPAE